MPIVEKKDNVEDQVETNRENRQNQIKDVKDDIVSAHTFSDPTVNVAPED